MTQDPHDSSSDLIKTFLFLCKDLSRDIGEFPEMARCSTELGMIVGEMLTMKHFGTGQIYQLQNVLDRCRSRLGTLYSQHPESGFLDALYRRLDSLIQFFESLDAGLPG